MQGLLRVVIFNFLRTPSTVPNPQTRKVLVCGFSCRNLIVKFELPVFFEYHSHLATTDMSFLSLLLLAITSAYTLALFPPLPQTIAEFDLGTVNYEVKSPKCHELSLVAPPHDRISFNFRCEQEAQEWATVLTSSLREAQRGQLEMR